MLVVLVFRCTSTIGTNLAHVHSQPAPLVRHFAHLDQKRHQLSQTKPLHRAGMKGDVGTELPPDLGLEVGHGQRRPGPV